MSTITNLEFSTNNLPTNSHHTGYKIPLPTDHGPKNPSGDVDWSGVQVTVSSLALGDGLGRDHWGWPGTAGFISSAVSGRPGNQHVVITLPMRPGVNSKWIAFSLRLIDENGGHWVLAHNAEAEYPS